MSRIRKNYPANFKAKVALSVLREDAPISDLALKYGVHATIISRASTIIVDLVGLPQIITVTKRLITS